MSTPSFTAKGLSRDIAAYFNNIKGEFHLEKKPRKAPKGEASPDRKIWDREPEQATFAGLAFFLGFNSLQAFVQYENNGRFAHVLKRGRLRIEAEYEKKLHLQSSTGAIFALKSMGWNEKTEDKGDSTDVFKTLR